MRDGLFFFRKRQKGGITSLGILSAPGTRGRRRTIRISERSEAVLGKKGGGSRDFEPKIGEGDHSPKIRKRNMGRGGRGR